MGPNQIITQARESLGLSPQELGKAAGISDTWDLEAYEDELGTNLSLAELNRLCEVLHLTPYELLEQPSPEYSISPSEFRNCILEDCHRRAWSMEQFSNQVGWDVQGVTDNPEAYLSKLNWDGLQDICLHLGINPLAAIPVPVVP